VPGVLAEDCGDVGGGEVVFGGSDRFRDSHRRGSVPSTGVEILRGPARPGRSG
jgi:hypothetical protein